MKEPLYQLSKVPIVFAPGPCGDDRIERIGEAKIPQKFCQVQSLSGRALAISEKTIRKRERGRACVCEEGDFVVLISLSLTQSHGPASLRLGTVHGCATP